MAARSASPDVRADAAAPKGKVASKCFYSTQKPENILFFKFNFGMLTLFKGLELSKLNLLFKIFILMLSCNTPTKKKFFK